MIVRHHNTVHLKTTDGESLMKAQLGLKRVSPR